MAVATALCLTACSDDDEAGGTTNRGKRLSTVFQPGSTYDTKIEYDSHGRVKSWHYGETPDTHTGDGTGYSASYVYTDGLIESDYYLIYGQDISPTNYRFLLNDKGYISTEYISYGDRDESTITYTYDDNGHLIKEEEHRVTIDPYGEQSESYSYVEYEWNGSNMVAEKSESGERRYTYTDIPAEKGGYVDSEISHDALRWSSNLPNFYLMMQGYFGKWNTNLIKSVEWLNEETGEFQSGGEYEYSLGPDGYVSTITITWDGYSHHTYILTWE